MKSRRSKWSVVGWVLGGAAGVIALVLGFAVVSSKMRLGKHYEARVRDVPAVTGPEALQEGKRLFVSRGCGDCHGAQGQGKVVMDAPPGRIVGTNLTRYAAEARSIDFVRAIRNGLARDGRPLVLMPSHELRGLMNDDEIARIVAYVQSLPRVDTALPDNEVRPLGNALHVFGLFPLLAAEHIDHAEDVKTFAAREANAAYGQTLAAGCTGCHGAGFSGGRIPGAPAEMGVPANLTPHASGLAKWSESDFMRVMREGVTPAGRKIDPKQMPWPAFSQMNDTELSAIFAYLKTLPPKEAGKR